MNQAMDQINLFDLIPKRLCERCKHTQNTDLLKKPKGNWLYCEAIEKWVHPDDSCASFAHIKKEKPVIIEGNRKSGSYPDGLPF